MTPELIESLREPESAKRVLADEMESYEFRGLTLEQHYDFWLSQEFGRWVATTITPKAWLALLSPFIEDHAKEAGKVLPDTWAAPITVEYQSHDEYEQRWGISLHKADQWEVEFVYCSFGWCELSELDDESLVILFDSRQHAEHVELYYLLTFLQDEN